MDEWNMNLLVRELIIFIQPITLFLYFKYTKDYKGLAILLNWVILFIIITSILSIYATQINPLYARHITGGRIDGNQYMFFKRIGAGGYSFAASLIAFIPIGIYYYKNKLDSIYLKKSILLFIILLVITIFQLKFFANILMVSIGVIYAVLGDKNLKKTVFIGIVFFIMVLIIPKEYYFNFFYKMASNFETESFFNDRFNDLGEYIEFGGELKGSELGVRASRYPLLFNAFVKKPITGFASIKSPEDISMGGHLYWMNKLTVLGLIGFIPYIIFHVFFIRSSLKNFDKEFAYYYLLSTFLLLGLGLLKALVGVVFWYVYFFIIPSMYYIRHLKGSKFRLNFLRTE